MLKKILGASSLISLLLFTGCAANSNVLAQNSNTEVSIIDTNRELETDSADTDDGSPLSSVKDIQKLAETNLNQTAEPGHETADNVTLDQTETGENDLAGTEVHQEVTELVSPKTGPVQVDIYCEGPNASGLNVTTITVDELTPQALMNELVKNGMLDEGAEAISLTISEVDGVRSLELDLKSERVDNLSSYGTAGEFSIMGSLCNTFLKAYDGDQILITVDGHQPSTGHGDYSEYKHFYAN